MSASQEALLVEILKRLEAIEYRLGATPVKARLTQREEDILEALGSEKMTTEILAKKAGYICNSHFKNTLSSLVKRGLLLNDHPGYRRSGQV